MYGLSEIAIAYYDNQYDQWREATIVAKCEDDAIEALNEIVPPEQRTVYQSKEQLNTTRIVHNHFLNDQSYFVAIETTHETAQREIA